MPFTDWSTGDIITATKLDNDNTVAVGTDTARTISVTHTWTASQTFTGGFTTAASATLGGHLLFTDATYDIGASGATRPRSLFLSSHITLAGTITSTQGTITASTPAWTSTATWNAGAVQFFHIFANITNTSSATTSRLIALQVGGTDMFRVNVAGAGLFAGALGVGSGVDATVAGLRLYWGASSTSTTIYGIEANVTAPSTATTALFGILSKVITTAAAFTVPLAAGLYVNAPSIGAGSAITVLVGLDIENQTGGGTNYAIRTGTGLVKFGDVVAVGAATPSTTTYLITPAGTTGVSSLRIPHGSAPTSPVDGDVWTTTAGFFVRVNGATVGPLS